MQLRYEVLKGNPDHHKIKYSRVLFDHQYTAEEFLHAVAEDNRDGYGSVLFYFAGMIQDCSNYNLGYPNIPLTGEIQNAIVTGAVAMEEANRITGRRDYKVEINCGYVPGERYES